MGGLEVHSQDQNLASVNQIINYLEEMQLRRRTLVQVIRLKIFNKKKVINPQRVLHTYSFC